MISASEDIGLADPSALQTAVAAAQAVAMIGFPRPRSPSATPPSPWRSRPSPTPPPPRSAPPWRTSARDWQDRSPPICATATTRGRASSATARATSTRTTCPRASPSSSTPRTPSRTASTTSPPGTAPRRGTRTPWSGPGSTSVASGPEHPVESRGVLCPVSGSGRRLRRDDQPDLRSRSVAHRRRCRGQPTTTRKSWDRSVGRSCAARMCPVQGAAAWLVPRGPAGIPGLRMRPPVTLRQPKQEKEKKWRTSPAPRSRSRVPSVSR